MTNQANSYVNVAAIKAEYAPYNTMDVFEHGYDDYMNCRFLSHYSADSVKGQAYDRGCEAAMKVGQANFWVEQNVGAN